MANRKVRTFSANDRDVAMLGAIARYHGLNKSATITSLVRKEFWRIFPRGTDDIKPDRGAVISGRGSGVGEEG
jgi:hypothetical protein